MKRHPLHAILPTLIVIGSGCSTGPSALLIPHGPESNGPRPSEAVVTAAAKSELPAAPPSLPDRIILPADYRLILLDGGLALIRDSRTEGTPIHLSAGNPAVSAAETQTRVAQQEFEAEAMHNRASAARMDSAFQAVMERSRALEEEAQTLGTESKQVADLLAQAQAKLSSPDGK